MRAYVLAAGYATRLHPLTLDRPKPLLEVGGRPILSHVARSLAALENLSEIVVVTNSRFRDAIEAWRDTRPVEVPTTVIDDGTRDESTRLGAIGDLALALERVPSEGDFVVAAGDAIFDFDLRALQREFEKRRQTLLVVRDAPHNGGPTRYNEVELDDEGRVLRFREKPPDARSGLAAIALYFFPAEVAALVARYLAEGGNSDAPGHFVAWLVERAPAAGARIDGRWLDIGTHETLAEARRLFAASDDAGRPEDQSKEEGTAG
jgi:glucose-1-phosphate thymidylyltransferase